MKISKQAETIKTALHGLSTPESAQAAQNIPEYDTVNLEGHEAYELSDEIRLASMLNTLKLDPQYYRSEEGTLDELRGLVERLALKDPYFVAQAICWSRTMGEKMRTINHLAAAILAPFVSGKEWGKRFYGPFDKKNKKGGCIYRPDDMSEIKDAYNILSGKALTNAMKKGFASAIESMDNYQLAKYKSTIIDICNIAHPRPTNSRAEIDVVDGEKGGTIKTIDAIMMGLPVSAQTWEVANSEAGQAVAEAVRNGELDQKTAEKVLSEAKNDNWEMLLSEGRLGMLAALRNIRSMMKEPRENVINMLCDLLSNGEEIRKSGVMPYQIDVAYEIVDTEFDRSRYSRVVKAALMKGYEESLGNMKGVLKGKTLVVVDCSGSMDLRCDVNRRTSRSSCLDKASLLAATIAKTNDCDVIRFGSRAEWYEMDKEANVFDVARNIRELRNMGGTNFSSVFELITDEEKKYDRIIILSDNECNVGVTRSAYGQYIRTVCNPYIYCIDLACYGTTQFRGDRVANYFGYGYSMFDDISSREFDAEDSIAKIRKYVI